MMSPVGVPAAAAATDEAAEAVLKWPPVLITTTPANIKYIKVMTKLTLHNGLIDIEVLSISFFTNNQSLRHVFRKSELQT